VPANAAWILDCCGMWKPPFCKPLLDGPGGGGSENEDFADVIVGRCWFMDRLDMDEPRLAMDDIGAKDTGVFVAHGLLAGFAAIDQFTVVCGAGCGALNEVCVCDCGCSGAVL